MAAERLDDMKAWEVRRLAAIGLRAEALRLDPVARELGLCLVIGAVRTRAEFEAKRREVARKGKRRRKARVIGPEQRAAMQRGLRRYWREQRAARERHRQMHNRHAALVGKPLVGKGGK